MTYNKINRTLYLNQNKREGPVAIVNGFIIYHSLDQQLVRKGWEDEEKDSSPRD